MNEIKEYLVHSDNKVETIGNMRVGIEVEFTGISRRDLATYLVSKGCFKECKEGIHVVSGNKRVRLLLVDQKDRIWYLVVDKSINPQSKTGENVEENLDFMCELITPVLQDSSDFVFFFSIIKEIRERGGLVNDTCGIHIHIDAPKDIVTLKDIFTRFLIYQWELKDIFSIPDYRLAKYTKVYDLDLSCDFMNKIDYINSISDFQDFIYERLGQGKSRDDEKNPARYYMLNFDTMHKHGTLEFRLFNSTLDTKVINKYLGWVYSFVNYR